MGPSCPPSSQRGVCALKPTGAPFYHRPWITFSSVELGMEPGCAPMCPLSSSWPLTVGRLHSLGWKAWGCEIIQGRVCWFQGRHEAGCWDLLYWAERGWRQVALLDTISDSVLELALPQPGLAGLEVFREGAVSLWNLMPVNVGCTAQPVLTVVSNK